MQIANLVLTPVPREGETATKFLKRIAFDRSMPILMLGESTTLSMTIALAFMRKSFDRVFSSTYGLHVQNYGLKEIRTLLTEQLDENISVDTIMHKKATKMRLKRSQIVQLTLDIDATKLSQARETYPDVPFGVLWFSFPWLDGRRGINGFLKDLIKSAASLHGNAGLGGIVIIGLTNHSYYSEYYGKISELIQYAKQLNYEYLSENIFIKRTCCKYGYRHRTRRQDTMNKPSIHNAVVDPSSTHIFFMR